MGGRDAWLIVDDTALPKKGRASVGVASPRVTSAFAIGHLPPKRRVMMIRQEHERDHASIAAVIARAFASVEHSDKTEPMLVEKLRASGDLAVSLVAVDGNALIGHVAFSPVAVAGTRDRWFGLAPVSVEPGHQGLGIGSALIRAGLEHLRSQGADGCVVLGNPAYYRRFGFERNHGLRYDGAPPEYFMCLKLNAGASPTGLVTYAASFTE